MTNWCVNHTAGTVRVSAATAIPTDPHTDPNWEGETGVLWGLDTVGDSHAEYMVGLFWVDGELGAVVSHADDDTTFACLASGAFTNGNYVVDVDRECVGRPPTVGAGVLFVYHDVPANMHYLDGTAMSTRLGTGTTAPTPSPEPAPAPVAEERKWSRLAGSGRHATAVEISKYQFPNGADVVFLVRDDGYVDALAGAVLTGGPILLVPPCGPLPSVVADEVRRLQPDRVIALGGESAVCSALLKQVAML